MIMYSNYGQLIIFNNHGHFRTIRLSASRLEKRIHISHLRVTKRQACKIKKPRIAVRADSLSRQRRHTGAKCRDRHCNLQHYILYAAATR